MTVKEVIIEAQAICEEYTDSYPVTESLMLRRVDVRQRELFALAASLDKEFYGKTLVASIEEGAIDLSDEPVEKVDLVQTADGTRVNIVAVEDVNAHRPPRMTLRDKKLEVVGSDLADESSLRIHYSARAPGLIDIADEVDLDPPYDFLLVWDLAKDLIRRTASMDGDQKGAVIQLIGASEADLLELYKQHVATYAHARMEIYARTDTTEFSEGELTADNIVTAAHDSCSQYVASLPVNRQIMYRRIDVRQRELFTMAASIDKEFYGVAATVQVASGKAGLADLDICLLYTSPSPRDRQKSRMPSSA